MTIEYLLDNFQVFRKNTIRHSILYYIAKRYLAKTKDYHVGKYHSILTSKLSVFRRERIYLPDNELFDFLIFCYLSNYVNYKVVMVFKKLHLNNFADFFRDDLIQKLNTNELTKNIELNHLANCLEFQRKAKHYYEIYIKELSARPYCKQVIDDRSRGQHITDDSHERKYDVQKICDELSGAQREVISVYTGLLKTSFRARISIKNWHLHDLSSFNDLHEEKGS